MTEKDVSRRALIKAVAWGVPVIGATVIAPAAAASGSWVVSDMVAAYRLDATTGEYRIEVSFTLTAATGGTFEAGSVMLLMYSGPEVQFLPFGAGVVAHLATTYGPPVSLDARYFMMELPMEVLGPFYVDRSALGE